MAKFLRVSCKCPSMADRRGRSNYLGSHQVDSPNTSHHHCKTCNSTWEYTTNGDLVVTRRLVAKEVVYTQDVAVIEVKP